MTKKTLFLQENWVNIATRIIEALLSKKKRVFINKVTSKGNSTTEFQTHVICPINIQELLKNTSQKSVPPCFLMASIIYLQVFTQRVPLLTCTPFLSINVVTNSV